MILLGVIDGRERDNSAAGRVLIWILAALCLIMAANTT